MRDLAGKIVSSVVVFLLIFFFILGCNIKNSKKQVAEKVREQVAEKVREQVAEKVKEQVAEKVKEQVAEKAKEQVAEKVLEFWTIDLHPKFDDYILSLLKEFEAEYKGPKGSRLKVRWIDLPINAIHQKFIASIAARRPPDLINLNTDMAMQFAELGALTKLDEIVPKNIQENYFPGLWKAGHFRDSFGLPSHNEGDYVIPWYVTTQLLIFNREIIKKTGLNPDIPPRTWEEFWEMVKIIKNKTNIYGAMPSIKFIDELLMDGIPVVSLEKTNAIFDNEDAVSKLEKYVELFRDGYIPRESIALGKSYQRALEMFQGGSLGFLVTGPQFLTRIKDNAPPVYAVTDVASLPLGKAKIVPAATMNLAVPLSSKNSKMAVELALFITNAKNQLKFCKIVPVLPSIKEAKDDVFFKVGEPFEDPLIVKARSLAIKQLEFAKDFNLGLPNAKERSDLLRQMLEGALLGRFSPREGLKEAARRWTVLLK